MSTYTDADVQAAAAAWWAGNGYAWSDEIDDDDKPFLLSEFRAVLDAVVPAIVARAKADALREAAHDVLDTRGERKWLLDRADEIKRATP